MPQIDQALLSATVFACLSPLAARVVGANLCVAASQLGGPGEAEGALGYGLRKGKGTLAHNIACDPRPPTRSQPTDLRPPFPFLPSRPDTPLHFIQKACALFQSPCSLNARTVTHTGTHMHACTSAPPYARARG